MTKRGSAAARADESVVDRRRSRRAGPKLVGAPKTEIDLTKSTARKALTALFPRPESETILDATKEAERAARSYLERRDDESVASEQKEIAGNVLCNAIGKNKGLRGKGWEAIWGMSAGTVDWKRLCAEKGISDEEIANYRLPEHRKLAVREIAEE